MVSKKLRFGILVIVLVCALQFVIAATETGSDSGSFNMDNSDGVIIITGPGQQNPCGNGIMQPPIEQCDGSDFGGITCQTLPSSTYTGGNLACSSSCTWITSGCTQPAPASGGDTGGSGSGGGGGGGGGGGSSCNENWTCFDWEVCKDGNQTRTCTDSSKCNTVKLKPITIRECSNNNDLNKEGDEINRGSDSTSGGIFSPITGAVIGFNNQSTLFKTISFLVLSLGLIGIGVYFSFLKGKNKNLDK